MTHHNPENPENQGTIIVRVYYTAVGGVPLIGYDWVAVSTLDRYFAKYLNDQREVEVLAYYPWATTYDQLAPMLNHLRRQQELFEAALRCATTRAATAEGKENPDE